MSRGDRKLKNEAIDRRSLLSLTTMSFGAVAVGSAVLGLVRAIAPSADVSQEKWAVSVDLNALQPGVQETVPFYGRPVFVLKLSEEQKKRAQSETDLATYDQLARNPQLLPNSKATLENRSVTFNNEIIVLDGVCPKWRCVPIYDAGDYAGWFCPCSGSHFDILGRIRKGGAPTNMTIPRYHVVENNILRLPVNQSPAKIHNLDELLFGRNLSG